MPTFCQTEISDTAISAEPGLPSQGAKKRLHADQIHEKRRDAPDRRQDQLPDEADDDEGKQRRQEDRRPVEGRETQLRDATASRRAQCRSGSARSMWMMKKMKLFFSAFQKSCAQRASPNSTWKFAKPTKVDLAVDGIEQRQPQRLDQRQDHHGRIDDECRQQEDADMPAHRALVRNHVGRRVWRCSWLSAIAPAAPLRRIAGGNAGKALRRWSAAAQAPDRCKRSRHAVRLHDRALLACRPSSPRGEDARSTIRCRRTAHRRQAKPLPACEERVGAGRVSHHFAGLYQLSRPFCSFSAATSGVSVPLITLADSTQVSFSRLGVPRARIW